MGLSAPAPARRSTAAWVLLSRTLIPLSALLTVVIALGLAAVLAVRGWQDLWFVIVSPSPQGVGGAILSSLVLLTVALPIVAIVAFCAAASLWDARIGGSAPKILRGWLPWATGLPPVIAGAAIFFLLVMLGLRLSLFTAAVELIVLNIGLDLKVISPTLFAMMVLMALATTMATTPILQLLTPRSPHPDHAESVRQVEWTNAS